VIARVVEDRSSETLTVNQLSAARLQENVVVPLETPTGIPVLVPTPVTVGVSISVESNGLFDAIVDLFTPDGEDKEKKDKKAVKRTMDCSTPGGPSQSTNCGANPN